MSSEFKKKTILIVDDTPENIQILVAILGDEYKIKVATNGKKALSIANSNIPPDIILLDIMMPEMDGFEVCKELKDNPKTTQIPIIFVTAKGEIEDESLGFELGASDYIIKPISPPIVKARVKTHLELYMKTKSLQKNIQELQKTIRILDNKIKMVSKLKKPKKKIEKKEKKENWHFEEYFLDDHKDDLIEIEEELDAKINILYLHHGFDEEILQKVAHYFLQYGKILMIYPIFTILGEELINLSNTLTKNDLSPSRENIQMALNCLEALIFTLKRWREEVLNNNLDDPNIYDNSMLSDIKTIILALENKNEEIESDIEFF